MTFTEGRGLSAGVIARALDLFPPTPDQTRVIEAAAEPALVVAGAGSGKTETMSMRVLWLVANGFVRADEILGLTFTRKAAGELAERIADRLAQLDEYGRRGLLPHLAEIVASDEFARLEGVKPRAQRRAIIRDVIEIFAARRGHEADESAVADDLLDRPRVSTYNAFADAIVRENAARIGRDPDAAMLADSSAWIVARRVAVRAEGAGLEDMDGTLGPLVDAIRTLSGELLDHRADPEAVRRYAVRQAAEFAPFVDDSVATTRSWESAHRALTALPTFLDIVADYEAEKSRRGVLEFANQVAGALDVTEAAPDVIEQLREQYPVVLLDEYQDTSVLQTRLLAALFRDSAVMAVGDPNQAIYGWRGASADNIPSFPADFAQEKPAHRFELMTSWRNDTSILTAANTLVKSFETAPRTGVSELGARDGAGPGVVDVTYPRTIDEEAAGVADWFARRQAEHTGRDPLTGAVLFRSKAHMQRFADALGERGVPHRILGLGGLLSVPEVTDVVSALRVIHDPLQGSALIRLLVGPRFAVGVADMGALHDVAVSLSTRDQALAPLSADVTQRVRDSAGIDEQVSIIDALDFVRRSRADHGFLSAFTEEGLARLKESGEMFDRLRRASSQPVPDLIRLIEQELRLDIELPANESRGAARTAASQLRAFADEVRGFLSVDERGTLGSVLSWLDHAEKKDDMAPRAEAPEPGVVQLLTVHGSKGLEWDAVAVVRLVANEFPGSIKNKSGGFRMGSLPNAFRGDAAALPSFDWQAPAVIPDAKALRAETKELKAAFDAFEQGNRDHHADEERRLAYVAVTRARTHLLLTGSYWAGQSEPRNPSAYLVEILAALGRDAVPEMTKDAETKSYDDENPYAGEGATISWPLDALGARRARVAAAADLVRGAEMAEPTVELQRLLDERDARGATRVMPVPTRVPASKFKDYVVGFDETISALARPMPERPYRQTRLGTLFHQWVEERSGLTGRAASIDDALWDTDDGEEWADPAAQTDDDARDLGVLREKFERSEWAILKPIEVETEVDFPLVLDENEPPHIMICKLDAVYRRNGRIEIVDWKTGKAPRTPAERTDRMLQLALYRLAYHRRHGVPLDEIDVALFYVPDELVLRDEGAMGERELIARWRAARKP
ncbi:ATP-dependent DNA helicase [Microbacterium gubbeenense]|uniref:ATP-dependent DNA helicase n=2 Tax=Microbacterium gubbeenense TaxID=159896 RepID=UPI003F9B4CA4